MENIELKKDLDKEIIVCSSDDIKVNKNTTISMAKTLSCSRYNLRHYKNIQGSPE